MFFVPDNKNRLQKYTSQYSQYSHTQQFTSGNSRRHFKSITNFYPQVLTQLAGHNNWYSITKAGETTTNQSSGSSSINIRYTEKPLISPVHFVKIEQQKMHTLNLSGNLNITHYYKLLKYYYKTFMVSCTIFVALTVFEIFDFF